MAEKMKWFSCFFGHVLLPARFGQKSAEAIAYIAWKGGAFEDGYKAQFRKWFRQQAERRPHLFKVFVPRIYPVDEFQFLGEYQSYREPDAD
jgi:hypothetical protein